MDNEIKGIKCEVKNCKYHDKADKCSAGHITVGCDCGTASKVADTICQTFECCDECKCDNDDCNC